jgi:hypothetical protein
MKAKNENKKMLLALAVVAALAAISFAGIIVSESSDAADLNHTREMGTQDTQDFISGEGIARFYIQENAAGSAFGGVHVTIVSGQTFTGTIEVGIAKDALGNDFVAVASLDVSNIASTRFTIVAYWTAETGGVATILVGNMDKVGVTLPAGNISVKSGSAALGAFLPSSNFISAYAAAISSGVYTAYYTIMNTMAIPFTGAISFGDDAVITAEYIAGPIFAAEGKIYGGTAYYAPTDADLLAARVAAGTDGILSIKGDASVGFADDFVAFYNSAMGRGIVAGYNAAAGGTVLSSTNPIFSVGQDINFTVEAESKITVGDQTANYADVKLLVEAASAAVSVARAVDGNGNVFDATVANEEITFVGLDVTKQYKVYVLDGANFYYGTMSITRGAAGVCTASISQNLVGNAVSAGTFAISGTPTTTATVISYPSGLEVEDIQVFTPGITTEVDANALTITFNGDLTTAADVIVLMRDGAVVRAYGGSIDLTAVNANVVTGYLVVSPAAQTLPAAGEIKVAGAVMQTSVATLEICGEATIEGDVFVAFDNADYNGVIATVPGSTMIRVNGMITYEVAYNSFANGANMDVNVIIAAHYLIQTPSTKTTHYYTTLEYAVENGTGRITIYGEILILEEIILKNDTATAANPVDVFIAPSGKITVGKVAAGNDPAVRGDLHVPDNVKITASNYANFNVVYGTVVDLGSVMKTQNREPSADVRIVGTSNVIYADVSTGFSIVDNGETIELLRNAALVVDATLKATCTFKDMGKALTVTDLELNILGEAIITGNLAILGPDGRLNITGSGKVGVNGSAMEVTGAIMIGVGGTLTLGSTANAVSTINAATPLVGVITVEGTLEVLNSVSSISVEELAIVGKVSVVTGGLAIEVGKLVTIGKQPTLLSAAGLKNSAIVEAEIDLQTGAKAIVYGDFATGADVFGNTAYSTKFLFGLTTVYATQYAVDPAVKIDYLYAEDLRDYDLKGWYFDRNLSDAVSTNLLPYIGVQSTVAPQASADVLFGDFVLKQYTVKVNYAEGVTWVVNDAILSGSAKFDYGTLMNAYAQVDKGFSGTPVLTMNGSPYTAKSTFNLEGDVTFAVSGVTPAGEPGDKLTLIEILLIIIVIIIGIISIIVALRLLRS